MSRLFSITWDRIILFVFPLLLVSLNSNWIFTPAVLSPDPWFYYAYFRYFYSYAPVFPSNTHYFVERLTWNIPGYYIYQIFPPEFANYVLHLCVYYVAIFSLYGLLRKLFNQRTAFISALVMGGYPWFLRAAGWDYVDGTGIAHMLLLLFLLALAAQTPHWKIYLFLAGIVHASLLITNLFWLGFAPAWAAFYLLLQYRNKKIEPIGLLWRGVYFIAGNLILTGLVSLYYHQVTGKFNFLKNSIELSRKIASNENNKKSIIEFYGRMPAYWHILPGILALSAAWRLKKFAQTPYHFHFITASIIFMLSYAWLVLWNFLSMPYLLVYLYCSFLIPFIFILFGALFADALDALSHKQFFCLILALILSLAAPFFLSYTIPTFYMWQGNTSILLILTIGLLIGINNLKRKAVLLPVFLGLSMLFYTASGSVMVFIPDRYQSRNNFLTMLDASREIDAHYPRKNYNDFRFWFRSEPSLISTITLASVYLYPWGSAINMQPEGAFSISKATLLKNGDNIILLSANDHFQQVIDDANHALESKDVTAVYESHKRIEHGNLGLTIIFTKIKAFPIAWDYGKKFDFDRSTSLSNWYGPEKINKNGGSTTFMWSGPENTSEILLSLPAVKSDVAIKICVISSLLADMPKSLKLFVNQIPVPITLSNTAECPYLYSGIIPVKVYSANSSQVALAFQVDKTVSPYELGIDENHNKHGLAFDWLLLEK